MPESTRNNINVVVPYVDGHDANAKNKKHPDNKRKVNVWVGGGGGTFEAVLVIMDHEKPPYREAEEISISRSFESALGPYPPFAFVRLDWPKQLHSLPNHLINDEDFSQVRTHYGATPRHGDIPKGDAWWSHLEDTHNFLIHLQDCQQPGGSETMAILRSQSQNLGGLFYVPERPLRIRPDKNVALGKRAMSLHRDGRYTSFVFCEESPSALLAGWFARRFLITMVEVAENTGHWATVIFDRHVNPATEKIPHLYILDPNVRGRSARADSIIHVWRQVLRETGYPTDFMAYVLPLTNSPAGWTTAYVALFSGIQAMRGLCGDRIMSMAADPEIEKLSRYIVEPAPEYNMPSPDELRRSNGAFMYGGNSDLRFRDWCLGSSYGFQREGESLDWTLHHLVGCAAMELGIKSHASFTRTPLRGIQIDLGRIADDIEQWSMLRAGDNVTMLGGFIPFCPAFAVGRRLGTGNDVTWTSTARYGFQREQSNPLRHTPTQLPSATKEECKPEKKFFVN